MRYATLNGFKCRWDTRFESFVEDPNGGVTTTLTDKVSGQSYKVHSKYLFGADGARSKIVQQLNLPLIRRPGQGRAINILIGADMAHLMENRKGNLHWILQPNQTDTNHPSYGWIGCLRMVKPWHEWLCIVFPGPAADASKSPSEEDYREMVRQFIGDDLISVQVLGISTWNINEIVAEQYSQGNVLVIYYHLLLGLADLYLELLSRRCRSPSPPKSRVRIKYVYSRCPQSRMEDILCPKRSEISLFHYLPDIAKPRVPHRKRRKGTFENLQCGTPTCRSGCNHTVGIFEPVPLIQRKVTHSRIGQTSLFAIIVRYGIS